MLGLLSLCVVLLSFPVEHHARGVNTHLTRALQSAPNGLLPIVLWHGMGDSCCDTQEGVGKLKSELEKKYGVYVHSIGFGSQQQDVTASYIGNVNDQVAEVCRVLKEKKELENGFDGIGFGQGGQFLRAVVERCQHEGPQMRLLITLGAQHQGVMATPTCMEGSGSMCLIMTNLISQGNSPYYGWAAENIVQAQYLKDPNKIDLYMEKNNFLADINNEKKEKSQQYGDNLASLSAFVMFEFLDDNVVKPKETAIFSYHDGDRLIPLRELPHYTEDWIGLKRLDQKGGLHFESVQKQHMDVDWEWFDENVIEKYIVNYCIENQC
ncbi:hypothetical protein BSKO_06932 [Bryopsis sp. KO-2023]|nr:hypothetical protein BSKO_06932 [Bryopsis sp. KO-2023]